MAGCKPVRSTREEPGFAAGRASIIPDARRWDAFWRAAEWGLARDPTAFDQVDENLWVVICEPSRTGMPRIRVYYSFDAQYIYLKWVELA
ncbi:MAG: hypothetical protein DLM71_04925 [Chloroflexi bacterium]|nr:hypothetical protein [Candidatus Dormibacteraeota bacterium]PZR63258.1 MAG: hypothetical protein DLM71_04925 [Chloroflexota bacterium]